ncbi:hypothetical protein Dda_9132 [Drechslerella dactyloides]|uniref:Uncharacterized protein n=1 Tax=Drechslerella dactyloides TaxID=74499 RepID=A0AAD6IPK8_DREDA|nr:hypothetical protein Dda_9132 [Drechslerella dactyloides]
MEQIRRRIRELDQEVAANKDKSVDLTREEPMPDASYEIAVTKPKPNFIKAIYYTKGRHGKNYSRSPDSNNKYLSHKARPSRLELHDFDIRVLMRRTALA